MRRNPSSQMVSCSVNLDLLPKPIETRWETLKTQRGIAGKKVCPGRRNGTRAGLKMVPTRGF
jgi:hypothetical protein